MDKRLVPRQRTVPCLWFCIVCFLIIILTLVVAGSVSRIVEAAGTLVCDSFPVRTYLVKDTYFVLLYGIRAPAKVVIFDSERLLYASVGITPIAVSDLSAYLGKTAIDLESELGAWHIDIGSGARMPSYITTDGHLVCFTVDNSTGKICHIGRSDLFSGQGMEFYWTGDTGQGTVRNH